MENSVWQTAEAQTLSGVFGSDGWNRATDPGVMKIIPAVMPP